MKPFISYFIIGWFFAVQTPASTPGANATMIVGPFVNEAACKAESEDTVAALKAFGIEFKLVRCAFEQEV